jgi:hypothetical protein
MVAKPATHTTDYSANRLSEAYGHLNGELTPGKACGVAGRLRCGGGIGLRARRR